MPAPPFWKSFAALMLATGSVWADHPVRAALELGSPIPASCIREQHIQREIEGVLARPVFVPHAEADVIARLELDDAPRRTRVELLDAEHRRLGTRWLTAADCGELEEALILALSLMLDFSDEDVEQLRNEAAKEELPAVESPEPILEPTLTPPAPEPSERSPVAPSDTLWSATVDMPLWLGMGPRPVVGARAGVGARSAKRWYAGGWLSLAWSPAANRAGGTIRSLPAAAGFDVCPLLVNSSRIDAMLCTQSVLGVIHVSASGYEEESDGTDWFALTGLSSIVRYPSDGAFFLQAQAFGGIPLRGYRVSITTENGVRTLFKTGSLLGSMALGAGITWK